MLDVYKVIGRKKNLFEEDLSILRDEIYQKISGSKFLVLGGAGTIGSAVVKEIFKNNPLKIHVIVIDENSLAELVRDIRSSFGYIEGDFETFCIDVGSIIFKQYMHSNHDFDYILNLSALKHVRSEKDPYTLMRLIEVNILNTVRTLELAKNYNIKNYFCVSTDKAANPVNLMGASKRIMEMFLVREVKNIKISMARFANVAFSNGSLLDGFKNRLEKMQPLAAPSDIKRYFITPEESGQLCLLSSLYGKDAEIFFPKFSSEFNLKSFQFITEKFLENNGFEPFICDSEDQARDFFKKNKIEKFWPCFFSKTDTTGEKPFEEFFTERETINSDIFKSISIVESYHFSSNAALDNFIRNIEKLKKIGQWSKGDIVKEILQLLPEMKYEDFGRYLDTKM